jgi:hypothetical protein
MTVYINAFDSHRNPEGLSAFDSAAPAPKYDTLPRGVYAARVLRGEVTQTKAGHDAYRMTFEVAVGPHAGRTLLKTWAFTAKALPYTKRDLAAFGLHTSQQLMSPFPEPGREYIVRLVVALQRGNDGTEFNDIKRIEVLRVDESPIAQFIVSPHSEGGPQ